MWIVNKDKFFNVIIGFILRALKFTVNTRAVAMDL